MHPQSNIAMVFKCQVKKTKPWVGYTSTLLQLNKYTIAKKKQKQLHLEQVCREKQLLLKRWERR